MNSNITAIMNELEASGYSPIFDTILADGYKPQYIIDVHGAVTPKEVLEALGDTLEIDSITYDVYTDCPQINVTNLIQLTKEI